MNEINDTDVNNRRRPYYIYAPPYTRRSAGIRVMHLLCHYLNNIGEDAYVSTNVVDSTLRTPTLYDHIIRQHQAEGKEPIAIYPEVVTGNPLRAKYVVRYILNYLGVLGGPNRFKRSDFHMFFDRKYMTDGFDEGNSLLLTVPALDLDIFNNDGEDQGRSGSLIYPGRYSKAKKDNPELFARSTVITYEWPGSPEDMANLLRRSEVLYSYATSAVVAEAILCGCPVVVMNSPLTQCTKDIHVEARRNDPLSYPGIALDDSEASLQEARLRTKEFRQRCLDIHEQFTSRLKGFVDITQSLDANEPQEAGSIVAGAQWGIAEWLSQRTPTPTRILAIQAMLQANAEVVGTLGVAVIVPDGTDVQVLMDTLDNVRAQHRPADSIWLVGNSIPDCAVDGNVECLGGDTLWPQQISNRIKQDKAPDFLWILRPGDRLLPQATLLMGEYRLRQPDPLVWYVDEAFLKDDEPVTPMLKPEFNLDLLRSYPYIGRASVFSTAAARELGGLDALYGDLSILDFVWRLVERAGPPVIGHIPEVLMYSAEPLFKWIEQDETVRLSREVTLAHLTRLGVQAEIIPAGRKGLQSIRYQHDAQPLISIIIPTRDHFPILQKCIESLMEKTLYIQYELLIVDNNSTELDARKFLNELESIGSEQIRILRFPEAFNFSKINNFAARHARGDVLLFLNNDIEVVEPEWLSAMLSHALRPEVGIVGARLDYPDGRVQHAGLVLGMENSVGFAFQGEPGDARGYMSRLQVAQNVSAVTAACMMMRRDVFDELEGFDEESFPVYYGDVDLALRARQAGFLTVWTPEARLIHMGGATRLLTEKFGVTASPDDAYRNRLYAKWLPQLASDPAYHPAYGKKTPGFDLSRDAARIHEPLPGRPLPVILASHTDWDGCGHYRIIQPYKALESALRVDGGLTYRDVHLTDVARIEPDVILLQGAWVNENILKQIERYQEEAGCKVILEFDDYLPNIPVQSIYRKKIPQSTFAKIRRTMEKVDWLVVSTQALAQEYARYHHDIRVAHNGLFPPLWKSLVSERRAGKKPRVGWAGGSSHTGDLAVIRALVKDMEDEVEWVFMGMQPKDVACEFHAGVPLDQYPRKLASLNLDLAVVPLEINQFNTCKSNLRLLELGACGVPVICTDIEPYRCDLPVTRVRNRYQDWREAIRSHLSDLDAAGRTGDRLREAVLSNWMLEEKNLDQWADAWLPKI